MGKRKLESSSSSSKSKKKGKVKEEVKEEEEEEEAVEEEVVAEDSFPGLDNSNDKDKAGAKAPSSVAVKSGKNAEDVRPWLNLLEEASKAPIDRAREMYEAILTKFPLADKLWVKYCEAEEAGKNYDRVENILKRTLLSLHSGSLWLYYVNFVKQRKLGKGSAASKDENLEKVARKEVEDAFEFAIKQIGYSYECGDIWQEYIKFIESRKCETQYDLGNRAQAIRAAYHRAVKVPVQNLEDIWKGFESFENGEKNIPNEVQQEYMKAKTVYLERKNYFSSVTMGEIPKPYRGDSRDDKVIAKWRSIIAYERGNPERIGDIDLKKRVRFIYNKALSALYFYPETWYDFGTYELSTGDPVSARIVLDRALEALPDSILLHFAVADAHEAQGRVDDARKVYENLESNYPTPIVFIQMQQFERRVAGVSAARAVFRRARQSSQCDSTVFAASAMMEFHNNKDARVARNVFELGMKRFPRDVPYIMHYLRLLEHLNQDIDLVTLYERVLAQLEPKDAFPIWERYREFCCRFMGDASELKRLEQVEARMRELYPQKQTHLSGLPGIAHRYAFLGQHPSKAADVSFFNRVRNISLGPHSKVRLGLALGGLDGKAGNGSALDDASAGFGDSSSKTPMSIVKLETLLPESLGENVNPFPLDYLVTQMKSFKLPPKSILVKKKKRKVVADNENEDGDVFLKRRRK